MTTGKTIVLGAGFLGERLAKELADAEVLRIDITDRAALASRLRELRPKAVINAAGKTGRPNVDWCESHPVETYRSNVVGALTVAEICQAEGIYLLHLASGCIFYGESPDKAGWKEDDFANPSALYSRTKYAADLVLSTLPNTAIARLRMPIDGVPGARNLITKLAGYKEVIDVENSVTVVEDLVHVVAQLIAKRATGIFHVTNPGVMRHRDLLALYKELVDPAHSYRLIEAHELLERGLAVRARSNCILQSPRLAAEGIAMRPIGEALRATMLKYATTQKR